jgi:hypothetical protein
MMRQSTTASEPSLSRPVTFTWRRAVWTFLATLLGVNCVLVLGLRTCKWDAADYSCPYYILVADAARQGQLVLWSPLVDAGCPAGFSPTVGAMSPVQLLLGLLTGGNEPGFRLYWLTVWCLGGLGILVLARRLAASPWLACVGAIAYTCSAIYTCHAEHTSLLVTMSLAPWVLWRLDVALGDDVSARMGRSLLAAAQAGVLWGLSALGGYPGLVLVGGGYSIAWGFGRTFVGRPWKAGRMAMLIAILAVFFLTGFAVLAPTYVGFAVESRGYTDRAGAVSRSTVLSDGGFPPSALATFASPYLCVWNDRSQHPVWSADISVASIYLSPLVLILALGGGESGAGRRFRAILWIIAVLCLLASFGGATPFYGWLYDTVPAVR